MLKIIGYAVVRITFKNTFLMMSYGKSLNVWCIVPTNGEKLLTDSLSLSKIFNRVEIDWSTAKYFWIEGETKDKKALDEANKFFIQIRNENKEY